MCSNRIAKYFKSSNIGECLYDIYDDLDSFSCELSYEQLKGELIKQFSIIINILLPPFVHKKKIIKGLFFCHCVDYIKKTYPDLTKYFNIIANSMWCSYPAPCDVEAYFTICENEERERYYREKYPNKNNIEFIPLQDAYFTDEKRFKNAFLQKKSIDVLMVSRFSECKNIDMFVSALKYYHFKYGRKLKAVLICRQTEEEILNDDEAKSVYNKFIENYPDYDKYIQIINEVEYTKMPKYYQNSKVTVLTSLIEGLNRSVFESICCNTPVIIFADYNRYAFGNNSIISPEMGIRVNKFDSGELAEAFHIIMKNKQKFSPRKAYLKTMNRKVFIDSCLKKIPYYKDIIYTGKNTSIFTNREILKSIWRVYKIDYEKFIYGRYMPLFAAMLTNHNNKLLEYYIKKFNYLNNYYEIYK